MVQTTGLREWLKRQWISVMLVPIGLALIASFLLTENAVPMWGGIIVLLIGTLHHRGFRGKAGAGGIDVVIPPDDARETTTRFAEGDEQPTADALAPGEEDDAARWYAAQRIFEQLLAPPPPLNDCALQIYLYDAELDALAPILEPAHPGESPPFHIGQGVTGLAWRDNEFVIAEADAARDDTFDLTPEQQERYKDLAAVAATPVTNLAGEVIAVLAASSQVPGTRLPTEDGFQALVFLADVVARVLVDLLKWFPDDYHEPPSEE